MNFKLCCFRFCRFNQSILNEVASLLTQAESSFEEDLATLATSFRLNILARINDGNNEFMYILNIVFKKRNLKTKKIFIFYYRLYPKTMWEIYRLDAFICGKYHRYLTLIGKGKEGIYNFPKSFYEQKT